MEVAALVFDLLGDDAQTMDSKCLMLSYLIHEHDVL